MIKKVVQISTGSAGIILPKAIRESKGIKIGDHIEIDLDGIKKVEAD